jgi:hypothetical protein
MVRVHSGASPQRATPRQTSGSTETERQNASREVRFATPRRLASRVPTWATASIRVRGKENGSGCRDILDPQTGPRGVEEPFEI